MPCKIHHMLDRRVLATGCAVAATALAFAGPAAASGGQLRGCNNNDIGGETVDISAMPRYADPQFNDIVTTNFVANGIDRAWARGATGAGVTVAVIDSGAFPEQSQLQMPGFAPEGSPSAGRTIEKIDIGAGVDDKCNHGTRALGIVGAPLDGHGTVGIAYRANVLSIKIGDTPILDAGRARNMIKALQVAVDHGAKVVLLAQGDYPLFGITGAYRQLSNKIKALYREHPDVMFVGAAGSTVCPRFDSEIAFPARMKEVVAVTGVGFGGRSKHKTACAGPDVDLSVEIGEEATLGRKLDDVVSFSASSDASSTLAGIAALVYAKHPDWSRDQVLRRLIESARSRNYAWGTGAGPVDAWAAAGGFAGVGLDVSDKIAAGRPYTVRALPRGDGPFTYAWSTGETTPTISGVAGPVGSSRPVSVTVTDVSDGSVKTASTSVATPRPPRCNRKLRNCEDM